MHCLRCQKEQQSELIKGPIDQTEQQLINNIRHPPPKTQFNKHNK